MDADTLPIDAPRRAPWLGSWWFLALLVVGAFALSLWSQHTVFPWLSWNRDEGVYLWHVDVLRAGHLGTGDGGHPHLFQPWLSAAQDGRLYSQYTLGWPLVLTAGAVLGSSDLAVAFGAALAVFGSWALVVELRRDRRAAGLAAALLALSPIVLIQGGAHLNYLFTLGLGTLCMAATQRGVRTQRMGLLVLAGAALGWIFLTRPYDAVVWGLLAGVPLLFGDRRGLLRAAGWAAVGALPLVALTLGLNAHLTGHATEFPITVADPLDQFGFGKRRLMPGFAKVPYGKRVALQSLGRSSFWLPFFLVGAHLGALVAAFGAWQARRQRSTWVLVALGLAFPLMYFPFFGTNVSSLTARLSGPIYYLPAYTALAALMAIALLHLLDRRPMAFAGLLGALLLVSAPITVSRVRVNHDLSDANRPWATSTEGLEDALVVVSPKAYVLFLNPFGDNGPDLDPSVLFASDAGPEVLALVEEHPDRTPYLQRADKTTVQLLPSEHPVTPNVSLTPMTLFVDDSALEIAAEPLTGATELAVTVDGVTVGPSAAVPAAGLSGTLHLVGGEATARAGDDLVLEAGLHTVAVVLHHDGAPAERRIFYVRSNASGAVELLAPGTAERWVHIEGEPKARWEEALVAPHLDVTPTGTPRDV